MKKYKMNINGDNYEAKILDYKGTQVNVEVNGIEYLVELELEKPSRVELVRPTKSSPNLNISGSKPKVRQIAIPGTVVSPIPGLVLNILVKEGDEVNEGDPILILEAMKMESEIASTTSGIVKKILVKEGASVHEDDPLIEIGV